MDRFLDVLLSSDSVAQFQRYFGVEPEWEYNSNDGVDEAALRQTNGVSKDIDHGFCSQRHRSSAKPSNGELNKSSSHGHINQSVKSNPVRIPVQLKIKNKFWYYLFNFGAALGDEIFFILFLPFCFWNVSTFIARRVVIMWVVVLFPGQGSKEIFKMPRPSCPPVVRLDNVNAYMKEYGMPSTHAMTGVCIPFTLLICTMDRYQYPFSLGLTIAIMWCLLVCFSRIYLGMHNILDVIMGLVFATAIMCTVIPFIDVIDDFLMTGPWWTLGTGLAIALSYPALTEWNSSRELATIIVGTGTGTFIGGWLRIQNEIKLADPVGSPPYEVYIPDSEWLIGMAVRTSLGLAMLLLTKAASKLSISAVVSVVLQMSFKEAKSTNILLVELPRKFLTYMMLAIMTCTVCPLTQQYLNVV
ncbi:sphingosine-1-phosphate phosphatase 2-like [Glandiceps talaboti]